MRGASGPLPVNAGTGLGVTTWRHFNDLQVGGEFTCDQHPNFGVTPHYPFMLQLISSRF